MARPKGSPSVTPFLKEMLERYVFASEPRFASWVDENFTEAVRELGKLQPREIKADVDADIKMIVQWGTDEGSQGNYSVPASATATDDPL